jgi:PKD repeat protein
MYRNAKRRLSLLLFALCLPTGAAIAQSDTALERIEARSENRPLQSLSVTAAQARTNIPIRRGPREVPNFAGQGKPRPGTADPAVTAATLQNSPGMSAATSVTGGFFGADNNDNGNLLGFLIAPPDTDGSVGPNHFVQMINLLTTIYDKNGNIVTASFPSNAFWSGVGGNCEPFNQGDPIVLYDEVANRWLVSQFAFPDSLRSFSQCVAISQTGDPTGAYNRYEFSFDGFGFNDYPKHGIVSDSITMIANLFRARGPFFNYAGTFLGVMDKAAMYAGQPASLVGFNIGTGEFGFVAGDLDGAGSSDALFATAMSTASAFDIWKIDVDWNTENASVNQVASIPVTPYDNDLCGATREACIPQPDGGPALEAVADRLMHRLQIRDFVTYKTMVTAHTVDVGGGRAGIRWYELRDSGSGWSLYQEGTYGPNDGENRWMASAAMNAAGDIGIGYLLAGENTYVSTAVTGQSAAASGTGTLDAAEQICASGSGVQLDTGRSGDYSSTSIDPTTGNFWHTNEVFTTTGQFQWATFVCSFSVGGGGGGNNPPVASFTSSCTDLTCTFTDTSTDSGGNVVAWDWDFGDGNSSTAQNPTHTYSAGGTYTVTLTATDDGAATGTATDTVTVTDPSANNPPTASFTLSCTDLSCDFDGSGSIDTDGTIVSYDWDFGDGNNGTGSTTSHTYASGSTYAVTLTVTDDDSATGTDEQSVTVTEPPTGGITLNATGRKVRGLQKADLTWSGTSSGSVDIKRDGAIIAAGLSDTGSFTDDINSRGGGSYVYEVCEAGTNTCSNTATVTF